MRAPAQAPLTPLDPGLPSRHVTSTKVVAVRGTELEVRDDLVVGEEPLEIRAAGPRQDPVQVAVTMRTPGHEEELAIGFLTSEGLLGGNEVVGVAYGDPGVMAQPDDSVLVRLARRFDPSLAAQRNFVATASCGICGKASIDDVAIRCEPLPKGLPVVARSVITSLPDALRAAQAAFERTGGLHAAGLFETDGRVVAVREDVGRHNALDKLIGSRVRARELPLWDRVLMVSGRVSFEIVQKAAVAGVPIICAVSAPSDLAVRLADRLGVTLVGFLRGDGFNVYSHDGRIDLRDLMAAPLTDDATRAARMSRVTALALDSAAVIAFTDRHQGLDRAALISAGHLDPAAPAKGLDAIGRDHRRESGEALLELAKDVLYGLLFGDDSTSTRFERSQRELLTLTLPRTKAGAFDFIPAATELSGAGMWRDPSGVSNDVRADNVIVEVEFGEVAGELVGHGIVRCLSLINNLEVNEQVLYARMINVEESTLIE